MISAQPSLDVIALPAIGAAVLLLIMLVIVLSLYIGQIRRSTTALEQAKAEWRAEQAEWRADEIGVLSAAARERAQAEALQLLEAWKNQELEVVRTQQAEMARREAQVEIDQWKAAHSKEIRQDAIQKSQAVVTGKVTEHFVPYLPEFTFNPKDARFLGTPIDFVVFDGLDEGKVKRVVLIEIKTGSSQLSTRERQVKNAVEAGHVEWLVMRPQLSHSSQIPVVTKMENLSVNGHDAIASVAMA